MSKKLPEIIEYTRSLDVLFVEDNIDVRNQLFKFFKNFFNTIETATDGLHAYELYIESIEKYDLIITDISMPKLNGIEFSKKIKCINKEQKIMIISAHTESDKLDKLREIGVFDILQKPVGYSNLLESLEKLFNMSK